MERGFTSGGVYSLTISSGFWRRARHKTPMTSSMSLANKWRVLERCSCAWTKSGEATTRLAFGVSLRSSWHVRGRAVHDVFALIDFYMSLTC